MCRSATIHGPVGERIGVALAGAPPAAETAIDLVEILCHRGEALLLGAGACFPAAALAQLIVLDEPGDRRGGELGLFEDAGRICEHCARGRRLEPESGRAGRGGHDDRGLGEDRRPGLRPASGADVDPVSQHERDSGTRRQRLRPDEHGVPPGQVAQRAERGACDRQRAGMELDRDELALLARLEQLGVDSGRDDAVVAGKALGCRRGRRLGGREEGVDASEQLLSQRSPRRIAEPLGREERGDAERLGIAQREVRDARQPGLEAVDDVEAPLLEREVEVRADADGDAQRRSARDGHGCADGDHVGGLAPRQCAPAGDQVRRAGGGSEHGDRVAERSQLLRDPSDMLVDVMRL